MKELSIEEKAKRYDEALEKAKNYHSPETECNVRIAMENLFPEVKENDDEMIMKELIEYFKWNAEQILNNFDNKDVLAWLEKQVEQKSVDNAESKFNVRDWVITSYGKVNQVVSVDKDGNGYTLDDGTYFSGSWCDMYHLWTIQDAKDGDALRIRNLTFIFQEITNNNVCHKDAVVAYCSYEDNDDGFGMCGPDCITDLEIITPATKEQRELLFSKMKEAGYEWDADKKELKKIDELNQQEAMDIAVAKCFEWNEQKPADKVEQKLEIGDLITNGILVGKIDEINELGYHAYFGDHYADVSDIENWHKWTIQDAKDGDVLAVEHIGRYKFPFIAIYKNYGLNFFNSYCSIGFDGKFYEADTEHVLNDIHPATKEQRELLFKKMKEAGYKWDADKKELKKIEQKPTKVKPKFNVGQTIKKEGFNTGFTIVKVNNGFYYNDVGDNFPFTDQDNWELVEQKSTEWNEEDDIMVHDIDYALRCQITYPISKLQSISNWIQNLKDRVQSQPKQEWGEEDEEMYNAISIALSLKDAKAYLRSWYKTPEEADNWIKSLKDRVHLQNTYYNNDRINIEVWITKNKQWILKLNGKVVRGQWGDEPQCIYKQYFNLNEIISTYNKKNNVKR